MAARFDHLQALADAWQARIDLDRALGVDPMAAADTQDPPRAGINRAPRSLSTRLGATP